MISTSEEFVLLLKKWKSESTQVGIVCGFSSGLPSRGIIVVHGIVDELNESEAMFRITDGRSNAAMIRFGECKFVYEGDSVVLPLTRITGEEYSDVAAIVTPSQVTIAVFAVKVDAIS